MAVTSAEYGLDVASAIQDPLFSIAPAESFRRTSQFVVREVMRRDGSVARSRIRVASGLEKSRLSDADLHDLCWLGRL